jgi:Fic family protein
MRSYEGTYTWLRFRADLKAAPPTFWILLGEVIALQRQLRNAPMPRTEARAMERSVVIEGLAARFALDGHALTREHVRAHLEGAPVGAEVDAGLLREVDDAFLVGQQRPILATEDPGAISPELVLALHRSLTRHAEPRGQEGRWRQEGDLHGHGVPAELIGPFMEELCDWLNGAGLTAPAGDETLHHALLKSLLFELHLAWIAPVDLGQHRLAGAVSQSLLMQAGGDDLLAHLLAVHLLRSRPEYLRQVQQAARGGGDPIPFMAFALRGLRRALDQLLGHMREAQLAGLWRDHVRSALDGEPGERSERQALLLMALGEAPDPVQPSRIPSLSPALARAYAGLTSKTLQRDLEALTRIGILHRGSDGASVSKAAVMAFKAPVPEA